MYKKYEYEKTTLTAQSYNNKITVELPADITLNEFLDACRVLAIGLTFCPDSWKEAIINLADEYRELDEYREKKFTLGSSVSSTDDEFFL